MCGRKKNIMNTLHKMNTFSLKNMVFFLPSLICLLRFLEDHHALLGARGGGGRGRRRPPRLCRGGVSLRVRRERGRRHHHDPAAARRRLSIGLQRGRGGRGRRGVGQGGGGRRRGGARADRVASALAALALPLGFAGVNFLSGAGAGQGVTPKEEDKMHGTDLVILKLWSCTSFCALAA